MRLIFIFGVFILLYCNVCSSKKTVVVFILDKSNWTPYDMDCLKTRIRNLRSRCTQNGFFYRHRTMSPYAGFPFYGSRIDNISSSTTSKNYFSTEYASTLRNLLRELQRVPSYSVIYVITNETTPSDKTRIDYILEKIQYKRTQVNFLIETQLPSYDHGTDPLKKYALITSISNGYIMGPKSFIFNESHFTDSMYLRLTSLPLEVTFPAVVRKDNKTYCADMDLLADKDRIKKSLDLGLHGTNADMPRTSLIKWKMAVTPLTHTIKNCDNVFYKKIDPRTLEFSERIVTGFTRKYFDYDYGFSTEDIRYLNETYTRPIHGKPNKLYVSFVDKNVEYKFHHFEILFVNGSSYGEKILLQPKPETNLYSGSFLPPNGYFYIQVTINATDRVVNRLSSTAMSAAKGFGEEHLNPIFEYKPTFKSQEVLPTTSKPPTSNEINISGELPVFKRPTSKDNTSGDNFEKIVFYAGVVLLGLGLCCVIFILLKYRKPDKKTQKRSDLEKAHHRAEPDELEHLVEHQQLELKPMTYLPPTTIKMRNSHIKQKTKCRGII
ncbi:uncharacterized protein LOC135837607 isoform X2 [Planococcus citri]|uniref:uncharacterized protein LOC135837607 isoform X2 n=1 Tax=Planococcus citri TaxID=170843 RepID=UPI0031F8D9F1